MKKVQIYKKDKWNMLNVELVGRSITVREISDQYGEECYEFISRQEMLNWAEHRFAPDKFDGSEEERVHILEAFKEL